MAENLSFARKGGQNENGRVACPDCVPIHFKSFTLTLLHSERPKLYAILVFLSAIGLNRYLINIMLDCKMNNKRNFLVHNLILSSPQCLPHFFSYKREFFFSLQKQSQIFISFKNNHKYLDLSYKMDLDL